MSNDENYRANVIAGVLLGALAGAGLGLGACIYLIEGTLLFPGDTIVLGAVFCGTLGYVFGEPFLDWLHDNVWWFW